jgi:phosphoenolpyruvate synthase/pyruvate phosphate dikinase
MPEELDDADRGPAGDRMVSWLHGPSPAPAEQIGGKAANLRRLARAGLPVPAGFCLTAAAHERHRRDSGSAQAVAELCARLPDEDARRRLVELTQAGPLAHAVAAELDAALARLAPSRDALFAVRSSAPGEDGAENSFAGQYESEIGVRREAVAGSVARCWASLYAAGAIAYRARNGLALAPEAMPVLVQLLVPAEAAAVAFSADPVTGDQDRVVLNVARGLGPPLVAGQVAADTFEFDRATLARLSAQPGGEAMRMRVEGGRVVTEAPAPASGLAVGDASASALAELCLDAEVALRFPVDLEAAWADGRWWIVQGRPITAL